MNNIKPLIAFFGSSLVSAYWNGAATYYRGIIKYLNSLGYTVTFYEPDVYGRQQNRDIPESVFQDPEAPFRELIPQYDTYEKRALLLNRIFMEQEVTHQ